MVRMYHVGGGISEFLGHVEGEDDRAPGRQVLPETKAAARQLVLDLLAREPGLTLKQLEAEVATRVAGCQGQRGRRIVLALLHDGAVASDGKRPRRFRLP